MARRSSIPLVTLVTAALLAGCVATDPLDDAAAHTLSTLASLEADDREAAALALAARGEAEAWRTWGLDVTELPAVLSSLDDWALEQRNDPAAITLASYAASATDIGSAFGIGFVAIGSLGKSGIQSSNDGTRGTDTTDTPGGAATISVGADGTVTTTYTSGGTEGDLSIAISASSEIQPCPDASGTLELSADVSVRLSLGSAGGSIELEVDAIGVLDDSAALATRSYIYRQQHSATSGGEGEFLDHSGTSAGDVTLNRHSSKATEEFAKGAAEMGAALAAIVAGDLYAAAEEGWMSGRCVDVALTPSEDPGSLEPDSRVTIDVSPRAKLDGRDTGGTIVATLSGEGELAEAGSSTPAPATLTYTAASEKDRTGTVSVESRSNRGVGRAGIPLSTGGGAYLLTTTVDEYSGEGTACSLTAPFEAAGSGLTFVFSPTDENGGSFRMSGNRYGIAFIGDGRYQVEYDGQGTATILHASGSHTLTTPDGISADAPLEITYTLTPTDPCE